jgi:hypothetical protein
MKYITVKNRLRVMNIIKNHLCNRMRDQWINDYSITYIENDIF